MLQENLSLFDMPGQDATLFQQLLHQQEVVAGVQTALQEAYRFARSDVGPFQVRTHFGTLLSLKVSQHLSEMLLPLGWEREDHSNQVRHLSPPGLFSRRVQLVHISGRLHFYNDVNGRRPVFRVWPKGERWKENVRKNDDYLKQFVLPFPYGHLAKTPAVQERPGAQELYGAEASPYTMAIVSCVKKNREAIAFLADPVRIVSRPKEMLDRLVVRNVREIWMSLELAVEDYEDDLSYPLEDVEVDIEELENSSTPRAVHEKWS